MASSLPPPPPATIRALPQEIVDRIAAGEVVQRPCSIAKELIENSQDAGSASIEISCTKGGMESLQITDDGCGMSKNDLPLAAVRFATSKVCFLPCLPPSPPPPHPPPSALLLRRPEVDSHVRIPRGGAGFGFDGFQFEHPYKTGLF